MGDLKNKQLPFLATVKGNYLDCYHWDDGDRLEITRLLEDLDSKNNEYSWLAKNLDKKNEVGGVLTYQIKIG